MADKTTPLSQSVENRQRGADAANLATDRTATPVAPRAPSPAGTAKAVARQVGGNAPGCTQRIHVAFFFDGTGNNLDADKGTNEHSNVARLFNAHPRDDDVTLTYRRYLPGLGTYFKEIGDPGGTTTGRGMGAYGQERLDWAFKELATILQKAEARAQNPTNRILEVRIAVFGFSRGSASARAFCRDLQKSCTGERGRFLVRPGAMGSSGMALKGGYPIDVYFLGLFDTVASVGMPMSANNVGTKRRNGVGWRDMVSGGGTHGEAERDLKRLAFGAPGADPSPGRIDGHGSWADDLAIVPLVSQCLHLAAGHEMRNSFPLDSVLDGSACPDGAVEMVYPGVHSDVGGGYRQGEGGKSSLLSIVPLRTMLEKAIEARVPLRGLSQLLTLDQKKDFALDEASATAYQAMLTLWIRYTASVPSAASLGQSVLNHMRAYWRYRLSVALARTNPANAARTGRSGRKRQLTPEQETIGTNEQAFAKDRQRLKDEASALRVAHFNASTRRERAEQGLAAARNSPGYKDQAPMWQSQINEAKQAEAKAYDEWRQAQAKVDGAANDSELIDSLDQYDAWLLEDAALIYGWHMEKPNDTMRPHYKALAEVYAEVVVRKQPMSFDSDQYKFFNLYVHDSLSGFNTDNTRPSDPRVIYIGGDVKYMYARVTPSASREAVLT